MGLKIKHLVILLIIIFLALCVFYLIQSNREIGDNNLIQQSIRIGNVGEYTIFNLVAKEKGFFSQNGLDAEIKEYSSGPAAIAGLLAKEVDINIAADFVGVRNIFDHENIRILASVNQHRVFQLAARKDLGINTPTDLKGKKIGVTKNSAGEFFLGDFLTANGLSISDITMVDLTPVDMLAQLEAGTIDAISLFEPHIYKLRKNSSRELTIWEIQGDQNINALVYTTEAFIDKDPNTIERYLRSLVQAEAYYKDHSEEVKELVGRKLNYEKAYIDYSWPRFTHEIRLSQELLLNMEAEASWAIANKLTTKTQIPNYLDYIYFDAFQKVKPYALTIIH